MALSSDTHIEASSAATLPNFFIAVGVLVFIGCSLLTARAVWEETVWTWEFGPQMLGFSLAHGPGAILFLFPMLLVAWIAVAVILIARTWIRRRRVTAGTWIALSVAIVPLVILSLGEGFWQRVFINRMAASPRASDLLMNAAARGDLPTVKAYLSHGLPVNAIDHHYHRTPLQAAAVMGRVNIVRFLIGDGADVNALDRYGDSALELAMSRGQNETAKLLAEHSAVRIHGSDEQRQKAIHEKVEEDIREMDQRANH